MCICKPSCVCSNNFSWIAYEKPNLGFPRTPFGIHTCDNAHHWGSAAGHLRCQTNSPSLHEVSQDSHQIKMPICFMLIHVIFSGRLQRSTSEMHAALGLIVWLAILLHLYLIHLVFRWYITLFSKFCLSGFCEIWQKGSKFEKKMASHRLGSANLVRVS